MLYTWVVNDTIYCPRTNQRLLEVQLTVHQPSNYNWTFINNSILSHTITCDSTATSKQPLPCEHKFHFCQHFVNIPTCSMVNKSNNVANNSNQAERNHYSPYTGSCVSKWISFHKSQHKDFIVASLYFIWHYNIDRTPRALWLVKSPCFIRV